MTTITIAEICDAIKTTIATASSVQRSQSYDELTEGMQDYPTVQVYFESFRMDAATNNDRTTFRGGVKQKEIVVNVDVYAAQRKHLDEDMNAVVTIADEILTILDGITTAPYFIMDGIKVFGPITATRVTFIYGDPQTTYAGIRIPIPVRVY